MVYMNRRRKICKKHFTNLIDMHSYSCDIIRILILTWCTSKQYDLDNLFLFKSI